MTQSTGKYKKKGTDLVKAGDKFGKWTVIGPYEKQPNKHTFYSCSCVCGKEFMVDYHHLIRGDSTGCKNCSGRISPNHCKKGHDLTTCGFDTRGACKLCRIEQNLRRKYGLSLTEYVELYNFQNGKCAICGKLLALNPAFNLNTSTEATRAEVDHRHVPKKAKIQPHPKSTVRGLLCGGRYAGCNARLGRVDNIEWLRSAALYLETLPAQQMFAGKE